METYRDTRNTVFLLTFYFHLYLPRINDSRESLKVYKSGLEGSVMEENSFESFIHSYTFVILLT